MCQSQFCKYLSYAGVYHRSVPWFTCFHLDRVPPGPSLSMKVLNNGCDLSTLSLLLSIP